MSDANIQIVKRAFERFEAGDIPGFLEFLSHDIEWDHRGPEEVPLNRVYRGREDVAQFFATLDQQLENLSFEPHEYFGAGDRVVAIGHFAWRVKSTGKEFASDFAMTYTVRHGKITHWRPIFDMTAEAEAFRAG